MGNSTPEPLLIVPATPDDPGGPATQPLRATPQQAYESTVMQPAAAVERPVAYVAAPVAGPAPVDPAPVRSYVDRPHRDWGPAIIAAFIALLVGGLFGFLIGHSSKGGSSSSVTDSTATTVPGAVDQAVVDQRVDDIFTVLLAKAEQTGSVVLPTPFPKLDQLLALSATKADTAASGAQSSVDALTADRDQLAGQVTLLQQQNTDLQSQLSSAVAERDALKATAASAASSDQSATIVDLQSQLAAAKGDLKTATSQLQTVQKDLDTANATLTKLHPLPLGNLVGSDIATVRSTAKSNGWQIVEKTVDSASSTPNSVITQQPANGATMINGSVLYVEVAGPAK